MYDIAKTSYVIWGYSHALLFIVKGNFDIFKSIATKTLIVSWETFC